MGHDRDRVGDADKDQEDDVRALRDKLLRAEQKNALLERNQKMLHEKMANIDELITKFTAVNAQLKAKNQRLAQSQQENEQLKRQLKEASATAASCSQSLRAKTAELEATKTAMSETLQENETLLCEKNSMQAFNAQLSAEIEGGNRWIDERRTMQKELKRLRKELNYEKTKYTARAKEAVDLSLEVRKQTNANIEAREELRNLKALTKQLESVLAGRSMENVYGEAVKEVQRQQALEKKLREERELQAALLEEERRLQRELRTETFDVHLRHSDEDDNSDGSADINSSTLDLNVSGTASDNTTNDKGAGAAKDVKRGTDEDEDKDGHDLEQLLSSEIDRLIPADNSSDSSRTTAESTPPGKAGRGRGRNQSKDVAESPAKRGRGRGRASARISATSPPAIDADGSHSPRTGATADSRGKARGRASARGRGRGRGEKRKKESASAPQVSPSAPKGKRMRTTSTSSSGGERMEEEDGEEEKRNAPTDNEEDDESFDEFASFLETALDGADDTDEAHSAPLLVATPASVQRAPTATTTAPTAPLCGGARAAVAAYGDSEGEEQNVIHSAASATAVLGAESALEMVNEMMMVDTSLPATPITPLPSTPIGFSSSSRPSTPIRYSSLPPPSPVRQSSASSSFPSYSAPLTPAAAVATPPSPASSPSPQPARSMQSPVTPASSSSMASSPSSGSPQPMHRDPDEPSFFSESEQEEDEESSDQDYHQMDVPVIVAPAMTVGTAPPKPSLADSLAAEERQSEHDHTDSMELVERGAEVLADAPAGNADRSADARLSTAAAPPKEEAKREEQAEAKRDGGDEVNRERERKNKEEEDNKQKKAEKERQEREREREREEQRKREKQQKDEEENQRRLERERREKERRAQEEAKKAQEEEEKHREKERKAQDEAKRAQEEAKRKEAVEREERRAKEERERIQKEEEARRKLEEEEQQAKAKAKEEEANKKREEREAREKAKREAEELRKRQEAAEAEERRKKREEEEERKMRIEAEDAREKAMRQTADKEKGQLDGEKKGKEKNAEGESTKSEGKRKREDQQHAPVVVERSRRPRELQQLYFSRRVEQLNTSVAEVAEDFSDDKNIKELDLLSCLESFARKGRPAATTATASPRRSKRPADRKGGEQQEDESLLAELVWRIDEHRQRRQTEEKVSRPKRPAEKRKGLVEQMLLRLETVLCRDEAVTSTAAAAATNEDDGAEPRLIRVLVRLGRRRGETDDARRKEEQTRAWRVLLHHLAASIRAWRSCRDRRAVDNDGVEETRAVTRFVEVLDDVAKLWSDVTRIDVRPTTADDGDQHDARRQNVMRVMYRVLVLLLDDITATSLQAETEKWHQVRSRCGWDVLSPSDESVLLVDIAGYCRSLGTHRADDPCKWDDETALVLRSMELMALCRGWEWTYQTLVSHVWLMLSETSPDEGHTSVAVALRLIGLMSRRAFGDSPVGHPPRASQRDKVDWLRNTLDMVIAPPPPSLDDGAAALPVFSFRCQLAAVESLRDIHSPSDDDDGEAPLAGARAWLASLSSDQRKRVPLPLKKALSAPPSSS